MRERINGEEKPDILTHWVWALPILLVVAFLSIRQIDLYPPSSDEFRSMHRSGWLDNTPFSPVGVIALLQERSQEHTPGYFLLLNLWGSVTTFDVAIGKLLGVYFGILALSMSFRLARDFIAPLAGLFALVVFASNAFHNFYYSHLRMYTLLVLTSGLFLWLYLRIVCQTRTVRDREYVALCAATFALINAHAFSVVLLFATGLYHLLFVRKFRRWWKVSAAILAALLLFSPYVPAMVPGGIADTAEDWKGASGGVLRAIDLWLQVSFNGQAGLVLLSLVGLLYRSAKAQNGIASLFDLDALFRCWAQCANCDYAIGFEDWRSIFPCRLDTLDDGCRKWFV